MAWEITLPDGQKVRTDEMLAEHVIDIAKAHNTTWVHVVELPVAGDGQLTLDLFKRLCERYGAKVPPAMTMAQLSGYFRNLNKVDPDQGDGESEVDGDDDGVVDPQTVDAPAST